MNPGPVEEVGKATGTFLEIMRQQPLALALVVMNLALLFLFWVIMSRLADQTRAREQQMFEQQKYISELLSKCVVPSPPTL